jgi:hypothetical protein
MKIELPVTATAVTPAAMETSTASTVEAAAKARLTSRRESSSDSSMIKAAERAGMSTGLGRGESMLRSRESVLRN